MTPLAERRWLLPNKRMANIAIRVGSTICSKKTDYIPVSAYKISRRFLSRLRDYA